MGLTRESFRELPALARHANVEDLFGLFDTDHNDKVDALEIFAAMVLLAHGTVEEKIEAIFPIFDFSGMGKLNFDEMNILMHSACRGLVKISNVPRVKDEDLTETCKHMFDAHNLQYGQQIKKDQVRRFLNSDVECARFIGAFHQACSLPAMEAALARQEQAQAAAFQDLCRSTGSAVPADDLLRSQPLRQSFGSPPEAAMQELVSAMAPPGSRGLVELERFAEVARAWDVFTAVDDPVQEKVDPTELTLLLWLWLRREPEADEVREQRRTMGFNEIEWITRAEWLAACVGGRA